MIGLTERRALALIEIEIFKKDYKIKVALASVLSTQKLTTEFVIRFPIHKRIN